MQPFQGMTDTQLADMYNSLCDDISVWVDTSFGDCTDALRKTTGHGNGDDSLRFFVDWLNPNDKLFTSQKLVSEGPFTYQPIQLLSFSFPEGSPASRFPCSCKSPAFRLKSKLSFNSREKVCQAQSRSLCDLTYFDPIHIGMDGKLYYILDFQIKVAFFSTHTEYSLWYQDVQYGKVNTEYA